MCRMRCEEGCVVWPIALAAASRAQSSTTVTRVSNPCWNRRHGLQTRDRGRATDADASREAEHIKRASLGGVARQVLHRVDEAQRAGRVADVQVAGDDRAAPAADPGGDR